MSRRRLRLISSSSDEEDEPQQQSSHQIHQDEEQEFVLHDPTTSFQNVTLTSLNPNPNPIPNLNPSEPIPVDISDGEFIDVSEDFSNSPPLPPPVPAQSFPSSTASRSSTVSGDEDFECPISGILKGLGLRLQRVWLDSCIHGLQNSVPGFTSFDSPAKAKLCFEQFLCSDMNISGAGLLPENVCGMHLVDLPGPFVLQVDEIVNISRPLRGRYQNAPSGLKRCLKLSMTDGAQRVFGMEYRPIKDLDVFAPAGLKVAICNVNVRHGLLMLVPEVFEVLGGSVDGLEAARQRLVNEVNKPPRGNRTRTGVVPPLASRATHAAWPPDNNGVSVPTNNHVPQVTPFQADNQGTTSGLSVNGRATEESSAPSSRVNAESTTNFRVSERAAEGSTFLHRVNGERQPSRTTELADIPINRENAEPHPPSIRVSDSEDTPMADAVEQPSVLTGDREIPFTYLASLSVKWAAMKETTSSIQGKVKCIMTGVKGFQFKKRTTFELQVYVDDGSLISEILVDHNVVQKGIGYSPVEVTAALSSSDSKRVCDMKETLKQFQIFLANFEGVMVIQMSKASLLPVAIEMNQGCSVSDAWLLLKRLKSSFSAQQPRQSQMDPIELSP